MVEFQISNRMRKRTRTVARPARGARKCADSRRARTVAVTEIGLSGAPAKFVGQTYAEDARSQLSALVFGTMNTNVAWTRLRVVTFSKKPLPSSTTCTHVPR